MTGKLVNTQDAQSALKNMMVGAYLDEIRAHSIQATLRFFGDQVRVGDRVTIDLILTCNARVVADGSSADEGDDDFFVARAHFLSCAHGLVGKSIVNLQLQDNGELAISTEDASILLWLSGEDYGDDDWVWKVECEGTANVAIGSDKVLYCLPENEGVRFYSGG